MANNKQNIKQQQTKTYQTKTLLRQLTYNEKKLLEELVNQVKAIKKAKQESIKQKSQKKSIRSSKKPVQIITNKPKLRICQADKYIKMCYLMLRQGLYGVKNSQKQNSYKTLHKYLQFYYHTYIFKTIPIQPNSTKLQIFQCISERQLYNYINKKVIRKIQKLAQNIHFQLQTYMTMFQINKLLDEKNVQQDDIKPLEKIIIVIERDYPWDRWIVQQQRLISVGNKKQVRKQGLRLQQLNFESVRLLQKITYNINKLQTDPIYKKVIDKVLRQKQFDKTLIQQMKEQTQKLYKQKKQSIQKNQQQTGQQKQKQKQKQQQLLTKSSVMKNDQLKIENQQQYNNYITQNQQSKHQQQTNLINITIPHSQQLRTFCKQLQTTKSTISTIQSMIKKQKLKQLLQSFNYKVMQSSNNKINNKMQSSSINKMRKLKYNNLYQQIKYKQIKQYIVKKQFNKIIVNHFNKIYHNYNNDNKQSSSSTTTTTASRKG